MNESEIERTLMTLRPAAPSRKLAEGIEQDLARPSRRVGVVEVPRTSWLVLWLDRILWSGLGASVAMVLFVMSQHASDKPGPDAVVAAQSPRTVPPSSPSLDASSLQPVYATEEDMGWHDEGVQFDPHGRPILKLTRTAVERRAWADSKNAGVVQMEKPRQEVLWVPVALH
jgi:hypothetical protein